MYRKALAAWALLVPLMVANGALRDLVYAPALGDPVARALSSVTGSTLVFAVAYLYVRREEPRPAAAWLRVGALWVFLTILFEIGLGLSLGLSLAEILRDYDLSAGRVWLLVLLSLFSAPILWGHWLRGSRHPTPA